MPFRLGCDECLTIELLNCLAGSNPGFFIAGGHLSPPTRCVGELFAGFDCLSAYEPLGVPWLKVLSNILLWTLRNQWNSKRSLEV